MSKKKETEEAKAALLEVGGKVSDLLAQTAPDLVKKMAEAAKTKNQKQKGEKMNTIAIAVNVQVSFSWPKLATLKTIACYEVTRLKRKVAFAVERVAMAFNPMPAAALA